jgi:hypothetical protein
MAVTVAWSTGRRWSKLPGVAGRSNTMNCMRRQAASSGAACAVVAWAWANWPRPAQSSPSMGVAGQPAVNQAGAAITWPPRLMSR